MSRRIRRGRRKRRTRCRGLNVSSRFEDPAGDYQALDFAGAFVDFGDAGVAVVALDGIFAAVTVAAVDLDGFVCDARGHFAGEEFGDGGVHAEAGTGVLL